MFLQGYARMSSVISPERWPDQEVLGLGGVFSVEWIKKESIPFHCTQHILNPWNDCKKVQISRDGQVGQRPDPRPCLRFVLRSKEEDIREETSIHLWIHVRTGKSVHLLGWAESLETWLHPH